MRSSTATGTTATAERRPLYRGRFAPSPTGLLHLGSLLAALASWLDARSQGGQWLLRIEDLDTPRVVPGAESRMLRTLEQLGLQHDGSIVRQSARLEHYHAVLDRLRTQGGLYRCLCSRGEADHPYSGRCRDAGHTSDPAAWRLRLSPASDITFDDAFQGEVRIPRDVLGDPILLRRDGIVAYQLAVVVDDLAQQITHVVRGADLLESTGWQLQLFEALGAQPPRFAHIPLLVEPDGTKLSKTVRSLPLETLRPSDALLRGLELLGQHPDRAMAGAPPARILEWAVLHWNPSAFSGQRSRRLES